MNILFITRNYPPVKGGTQRVAFELYSEFSKSAKVYLIKWGRSGKWMPFVMPYFLFKAFFILLTKKVDVIYLGDAVVSPIGFLIKLFFRKPVVVTVHGLDITYSNYLYKIFIPYFVSRMDKVICVSNYTKNSCVNRGISESKTVVILNGISDIFFIKEKNKDALKEKFKKKFGVDISNKKVILSVGRFVRRKGFDWFIKEVFQGLNSKEDNYVYLLAGNGPWMENIAKITSDMNLDKKVIFLGMLDDNNLRLVYNVSDVFVMPNIPIENDVEGFGIVNLEASSCQLPVISSRVDGVSDAVKDGKNGVLINALDNKAFIDTIEKFIDDYEFGVNSRKYTIRNYDWKNISKLYMKEFLLVMNFYEKNTRKNKIG